MKIKEKEGNFVFDCQTKNIHRMDLFIFLFQDLFVLNVIYYFFVLAIKPHINFCVLYSFTILTPMSNN
jgi:hypothetical protein